MYASLVQPIFDYCSVVWEGINIGLADNLQKLQNRAARIITHATFDASSGPLLELLGWDRLSTRRNKLLAIEMYEVYNHLAPTYLLEKFKTLECGYNLRGSSTKLSLPLPKTNYGKRRFGYKGAYLWNQLPQHMRSCGSIYNFKTKLKKLPVSLITCKLVVIS